MHKSSACARRHIRQSERRLAGGYPKGDAHSFPLVWCGGLQCSNTLLLILAIFGQRVAVNRHVDIQVARARARSLTRQTVPQQPLEHWQPRLPSVHGLLKHSTGSGGETPCASGWLARPDGTQKLAASAFRTPECLPYIVRQAPTALSRGLNTQLGSNTPEPLAGRFDGAKKLRTAIQCASSTRT